MENYFLLVIEDNEGDQVLLREALSGVSLPYTMHCISDGEKALEHVTNLRSGTAEACPDLVLLDLNLPKVDGISVLEAIRRNPALASVPVVVMSSSSSPQERDRIASFSVARQIVKPTDLDAFLLIGQTIRDVLGDAAQAASSSY